MNIKPLDVTAEATIVGIESLMYDHLKEVSFVNPELLKIDWDKYAAIQSQGNLILFGAFEDDLLVGYCCVILTNPLHYKNQVIAISDTIFVLPEFRNSSLGLKLISAVEKKAKELGASLINWYAKPNTNLEKVFEKRYIKRDIVFMKEL